MKIGEGSSLFLKLRKRKKKVVKVKKKAGDEEGGKSENERKRQCANEVERRMKKVWNKWLVI